jgi:hypothetical protein
MATSENAAITFSDDHRHDYDSSDPGRERKVPHVAPNDVESLYSEADIKEGDIKRKQVRPRPCVYF